MFANATLLTGTSDTGTGTNVGATGERGEPNTYGTSPIQSVWWKWTAPVDGQVNVDTIGSDYPATVAAYTGSAVNALTLVATDDGKGGSQTHITFFATVGTTYYFPVDGIILVHPRAPLATLP